MAYTAAQVLAVEVKIAALNVKKFSSGSLSIDEVAELDGLIKQHGHMIANLSTDITCGDGKLKGFDT